MITQEVHLVLNIAMKEAIRMRHEYVLCDHLMYSICFNEQGRRILEKCGLDVEKYCLQIERYLEKNVPTVAHKKEYSPNSSLSIEKVINRAINHAISSDQKSCDVSDILASIIDEKECYSIALLVSMEVNKLKLLSIITDSFSTEKEKVEDKVKNKDADFLKKNLVDLVEKAKNGEIDPLIGRKNELQETFTILSRRKKNNPILVGEPGVGKTAIAEGLAMDIAEKKIHPFFQNFHLYSLEVSTLLAGTKFRGDFEEKVKKIFTLLEKKDKVIVFIDEIHTVIGAGATGGNQLDVSNLLKPFLTSGKIRCIGATTYKEYRQHFQKDHALQRRFEKVEIAEPSDEDVFEILNKTKGLYEKFHTVKYTEKSLWAMINLSKRYLSDKKLPDSAIDVLDLAAARLKLSNHSSMVKTVDVVDVQKVVSFISKIPVTKMGKKEKSDLVHLEERILSKIFYQDAAVRAAVKAIKISRSVLSEKDKPTASMLFTGPTGVGKTELCRVLSGEIGLELLRFDMSEYMEAHSVSKLVGAPPGYVGYGDMTSQLTEKVKRHPHCLLLLDEIEKAHPDVLNIFLQVLDYGALSDSLGNKISFKNAIIVMTSNAGAKEMASNSIGFVEDDGVSVRVKEQINETFSPEFRNRLSNIIHFNFLPKAAIVEVLHKFMNELNDMLKEKKIIVKLSEEAIDFLVLKGYDTKMGARPMKRVIDKEIKEAIVEDELFGDLMAGGTAYFNCVNKALVKKIIPLKKKKDTKKKETKKKETKKKDAKKKDAKKGNSKLKLKQTPKSKKNATSKSSKKRTIKPVLPKKTVPIVL